jgi:hypothetical protein
MMKVIWTVVGVNLVGEDVYYQESILDFCRLLQSQNNIVKYCILQICCKIFNL